MGIQTLVIKGEPKIDSTKEVPATSPVKKRKNKVAPLSKKIFNQEDNNGGTEAFEKEGMVNEGMNTAIHVGKIFTYLNII